MNVFHPSLVLALRYFSAVQLSKIGFDQAEKIKTLQTQAFFQGRLANLQGQVMNLPKNDLKHTRPPTVFCSDLAEAWRHGYCAATLERINGLSKHALASNPQDTYALNT